MDGSPKLISCQPSGVRSQPFYDSTRKKNVTKVVGMGSLLRSESMSLAQLFLQTDAAYACVAELGEIGLVQFRDLNPNVNAYQRKFVNEVRRCDEMERKLRFIEGELQKDSIEIPDVSDHIPAPLPKDMVELEAKFERLEEELLEINGSMESLRKNYIELNEMLEVLDRVQQFFDEGHPDHARETLLDVQQGIAGPISDTDVGGFPLEPIRPIDRDEKKEDSEMQFIAGVLQRSRARSFERMLWRWCRGNVFVRTSDISKTSDPLMGDPSEKSVFIIFFYGEALRARAKKVCDGFSASVYNCPESSEGRAMIKEGIAVRIAEMKTVLNQTIEHRQKVLRATAQNHKVWCIKVLKIKSIFHTLNMFSLDITQKCLIAECWIPKADMPAVQNALKLGTEVSGTDIPCILNEMETNTVPPTFHKVNKFTRGFQNIVDSYGIATYREINPAPWTIITFPFIFAVMFGDAGHGFIMFLAALAFVIFEQKLADMKIRDEIFNTFFGGRYVILLMGLFSIYTGLIYNDIYSKAINIFGSSWKNPYNHSLIDKYLEVEEDNEPMFTLPPEYAFDNDYGPYPFGVDPVWNLAENRLNYLNPLKMKLSVIIGVSQMLFGLILSFFNHVHFKAVVDILFMFIPQLVFLSCIFIYLCCQILIKWICFSAHPGYVFGFYYPSTHCAPSLLIGLINMFMMKSRLEGFVENNKPDEFNKTVELDQCYLQQWYPNQALIEQIFLILAVVSVPVMLLVKPIILCVQSSRGKHIPSAGHGGDEGEEFSFGDTMVYQAIHTIEYCLGCISHTASYLRLWALSLAHAQLSEVLWSMVFNIAFTLSGYVGIVGQFFIFWAFAVLTVSILILMEGLSAFLHALRLHWVEFQSKFYGGLGYQFEPLRALLIGLVAVEFQSKFYGGLGYQFEPFSFELIIRQAEGFDS
ncbi:putative V-type proton ATPase subunit [Toxocara canis]|uniref:V-type proton ATPase subunit a n=1 Tax=Toxocara canis TaxID=6265 RepID=A0A0B2VF02_TOXCA|nr:putative V-type proton ATPase subunit [Toxocara canis]